MRLKGRVKNEDAKKKVSKIAAEKMKDGEKKVGSLFTKYLMILSFERGQFSC